MKKIITCFLLLPILVSCIPNQTHQKNFFQMNKNKDELSYQFEANGLKQITLELVKYENKNKMDTMPLGQFNYNEVAPDEGTIAFKADISKKNQKIIRANYNSKYFKNSGEIRILYSDINLSSYTQNILISQLQINESKNDIQLIEYVKDNDSTKKYYVEMDIHFNSSH